MHTLYLCSFDNIFLVSTVDYIAKFECNLISFLFIWTLHIDCSHIDDLHPWRRSRAEFGVVVFLKWTFSKNSFSNTISVKLVCAFTQSHINRAWMWEYLSSGACASCSLISTFVIRLLESIISRLATSKISIFLLVSVAEQAGFNLTLSETPKTGFVASRPNTFLPNFMHDLLASVVQLSSSMFYSDVHFPRWLLKWSLKWHSFQMVILATAMAHFILVWTLPYFWTDFFLVLCKIYYHQFPQLGLLLLST